MGSRLTAEYLRSRVIYDPATGIFTWKLHPGKANGDRAWDKQWAGKPVVLTEMRAPGAGCAYYIIRMFGERRKRGRAYGAHRIAWLYVTGEWPEHEINHRDNNPLNNRFDNLRAATHSQNMMNKGPMKNNRLGVKGVSFETRYKTRPYRAQIRIPGTKKVRMIGRFATVEEASAAYEAVARELHGEFFHRSSVETTPALPMMEKEKCPT